MTWSRVMRGILISSMAFLFAVSCTWGQHSTTSLRGTITDEKGASVPGALVTLESASLGISLSMKSDKDGGYQFQELRPATYTVTVTSAGFATLRESGVELLIPER
jgi:Carboxypeptidase regulatory-like domain